MEKISLLLLGVLVSSLTFAGPGNPKSNSGMAVVKRNATSFNVIYKGEETSNVKVQIFDERNQLVFTETIRKSRGFARPYNFDGLVEGEYTIKINNGSSLLTETIDYHRDKAENLAHLLSLKDGKFLLTVAGRGEDRLTVRIFDEDGKRVYDDVNIVNGNFAQVYNLSKLQGPFSFEVTGKSGTSNIVNK